MTWTSGCPNFVLGYRWGVTSTLADEDWLNAHEFRRSQGGWTDGDVWVGPITGSKEWLAQRGDLEAQGATPEHAVARLALLSGPGSEAADALGGDCVPASG